MPKKKSAKKDSKRAPSVSSTQSNNSASTNTPKKNEDIIGNNWKTKIVKKSVVRELNEAFLYESSN